MSDWEDAKVSEPFICTDCGRRVSPFVDFSRMHLCPACVIAPGWWTMPELVDHIDPNHERAVD